MPRPTAMLYCLLAIMPAAAIAAPTFEEAVIEELRCSRPPHPGPILAALARVGVIDLEDNRGYDSLSCFELVGGLTVKGMTFSSLCGFEENEAIRDSFPGIFWRGPGTSPGQTLEFYSEVPASDLQEWHARHVGGMASATAVGEITDGISDPDARSSVGCSNWMR